jgi:hypothetical protein
MITHNAPVNTSRHGNAAHFFQRCSQQEHLFANIDNVFIFFTKLYIYFFSTLKHVRQVQNPPFFSLISTRYAIYSLTLCPQKPYAVEAPSNRIHEHIYRTAKAQNEQDRLF